jgi:hypothetical protein
VIFCYLFSSALPRSLNFPFVCVIGSCLSVRATFCLTNPDYRLIWMTPHYSGLARVYCNGFQNEIPDPPVEQ